MGKTKRTENGPKLLRGAAAGLAAGLVASLVMHGFQAVASGWAEGDSDEDPSTVKAADRVMAGATGEHLRDEEKTVAGNLVHYGVGALLGIAYGIAAEYRPEVTKGGGTMFGSATALLLDEGAVPAAGLSAMPGKVPAAVHAYGAAAHLVYGGAAEATRAAVVALLK